MRPRSLLILLLIVVGLGAFIWFFERDLPSTEERRDLAKKAMRLATDEVVALSIETERGAARFERVAPQAETASAPGGDDVEEEDAAWRLVEPMTARADSSEVNALLDALAALEKRRTLEDVDQAAAGLDAPRATVELDTAEGGHRLLVGAPIPASSDMVMAIDDAVYAVSNLLWTRLDKQPGDWRDRDVLPFDRDRIERIELSGASGGPPVALERAGERFRLVSPVVDRADGERVDELLSDLEELSADAFIDDPGVARTDLGLEPARRMVTLTVSGEDEPVRIALGDEKAPDTAVLYAHAFGQLFETADALIEPLDRPVPEWRAAMWSTFEVYQTDSFTVSDDAGTLEVRRDGADWLRGEHKIENEAVRDFIYAATSAAADGFLDTGRDALGDPVLVLELVGEERSERLELHAETEAGVPATVSGRDAVLLLPTATVEDIRLKLQDVRDAQPLPAEDSPLGEGGGA